MASKRDDDRNKRPHLSTGDSGGVGVTSRVARHVTSRAPVSSGARPSTAASAARASVARGEVVGGRSISSDATGAGPLSPGVYSASTYSTSESGLSLGSSPVQMKALDSALSRFRSSVSSTDQG